MTTKKILSILICLVMLMSLMPMSALAEEGDGLCEHHTVHDSAVCNYIAGVVCNHDCDNDPSCYTDTKVHNHVCAEEIQIYGCELVPAKEAVHCGHDCTKGGCAFKEEIKEELCECSDTDEFGAIKHNEGCGYVPHQEGVSCDFQHIDCGCADAQEAYYICKHTCQLGTDCYSRTYHCAHIVDGVHGEGCGYIAASDCTYECTQCKNDKQQQPLTDPAPQGNSGEGDEIAASATELTVTVNETNPIIYDGTPKFPAVVVYDGNTPLTWQTDYEAIYEDNINAGTATVTVTGTGTYEGSSGSVTFKIDPMPVNGVTVTPEKTSYEYTGNKIEPEVTVTHSNGAIPEGGYEVIYSNNTNVGDNATITVTPKQGGNYTFTNASVTFSITAAHATQLTVTVNDGPFTYKGSAHEPTVTVKYGETTLTEDADYTVAYTKNVNAGTATVTVTGKAGTDYADKTASATFTIDKADVTVALGNLSKTYGSADPAITATVSGLMQNETITFIYNRETGENVGTYKIGATPDANSQATAANYDITCTGTLTITAKEIKPVLKLDRTSYGYTGKTITPTVTVYDGNTVVPSDQYTVSYANNTAVGTGTVTVSAKTGGNYTFTNTAINFSIVNNVPYRVVLGNGGCWYRGSYYGLGFRCDGPYENFLGLTIDGQPVDKSYYMASSGSTNVGLYPQLLKMLGNGTHYITFKYTSGSATGVFYVGSTAINAVMTGDDSNVGLLALVMCLGLLSSVTILSVLRKKKSGA